MMDIKTTATFVRKLKQQAKVRAKANGIPLHQALDEESREAGYADFHQVNLMRKHPGNSSVMECGN